MRLPAPAAGRPGMTLLEVLVATIIFMFSIIALSQLIGLASDMAVENRDLSRGQMLAQSKMNEVMAGAVALTGTDGTFELDDADWSWSLECSNDSTATNLWRCTVTVNRARANNTKFEYTLSQMILDPMSRGTFSAGGSGTSGTSGTTP